MAEKLITIQDIDILFMKDMNAAEILAKRFDDLKIKVFIFVGDDPLEIQKLDNAILERAGLKRIEKPSIDWTEWWSNLFQNLRRGKQSHD